MCIIGAVCTLLVVGAAVAAVLLKRQNDDAPLHGLPMQFPGSTSRTGIEGVRNISAAFDACPADRLAAGSSATASLADAALDERYQGFTVASFGFNASGINDTTRCDAADAIARGTRSRFPGGDGGDTSERDVFVALTWEPRPVGAVAVYNPIVATIAIMFSSEMDAIAVVDELSMPTAGQNLVQAPLRGSSRLRISASNASAVPLPPAIMAVISSGARDGASSGSSSPSSATGPMVLDLAPLRQEQARVRAAGSALPSATSSPTPSGSPSVSSVSRLCGFPRRP